MVPDFLILMGLLGVHLLRLRCGKEEARKWKANSAGRAQEEEEVEEEEAGEEKKEWAEE